MTIMTLTTNPIMETIMIIITISICIGLVCIVTMILRISHITDAIRTYPAAIQIAITARIPTLNKMLLTKKRVPTTSNRVPTTTNRVPTTSNRVPITSQKVPITRNRVPTTSKTVPKRQNRVQRRDHIMVTAPMFTATVQPKITVSNVPTTMNHAMGTTMALTGMAVKLLNDGPIFRSI